MISGNTVGLILSLESSSASLDPQANLRSPGDKEQAKMVDQMADWDPRVETLV